MEFWGTNLLCSSQKLMTLGYFTQKMWISGQLLQITKCCRNYYNCRKLKKITSFSGICTILLPYFYIPSEVGLLLWELVSSNNTENNDVTLATWKCSDPTVSSIPSSTFGSALLATVARNPSMTPRRVNFFIFWFTLSIIIIVDGRKRAHTQLALEHLSMFIIDYCAIHTN